MQHIAQRVFLIHEECIKADKEKEGKAGKKKKKKTERTEGQHQSYHKSEQCMAEVFNMESVRILSAGNKCRSHFHNC